MRAVILATGYNLNLLPLIMHRPTPLLRVLDKPMIEHVIEFLVRQGIFQFDIVLSHFPDMIELYLRGGRRWGAKIVYHIAKDPKYPFAPLIPAMRSWPDDSILLGKGDVLPHFQLDKEWMGEKNIPSPLLFSYPSKEWSGWGIFPSSALVSLNPNTCEEDLFAHFKPMHEGVQKATPFLSVRSFIDLQKTNEKLLQSKSVSTMIPATARMVEPGIWISRGTTIHPSVRIKAPVFIGESCQIKQYAQIGPHVVIENNCLIDNKSIVESALICERSYIGEGLEVRHCIIDRNILINITLETNVMMKDDFILGELKTPSFREYLLRSLGRYFAAVLLLLFSPLLIALYSFRHVQRKQVVLLPASDERHHWKTFDLLSFSKEKDPSKHEPQGFLACLPMLLNIVRGELYFTGVPPRTMEEVEHLPADWKRLYLQSKAGLITLAMVEQSKSPSQDEMYVSETLYVVNRGLWYDIVLCFRWIFTRFQ